MNHGGQSEVGVIARIMIKHPEDAFLNQENIDSQWERLNYSGRPDYRAALAEYDAFVDLIEKQATDVRFLPSDGETGLDSIYVHDPVVITDQGAILCNMGKVDRRGEPQAIGRCLEELDIPILGAITGEGRLEGGDLIWLDSGTLAVGQGYRTNAEGIRQLRELTRDFVAELIVVGLPHWSGPGDVLHLMSLISPVDDNLAVVYSRLLPVPFRLQLLDRGIHLIEVPDAEFETMGCNVLALAPRKAVVLAGNPLTRQMLEDECVEVFEYKGEQISSKGAGGPTCLTRPLLRR